MNKKSCLHCKFHKDKCLIAINKNNVANGENCAFYKQYKDTELEEMKRFFNLNGEKTNES